MNCQSCLRHEARYRVYTDMMNREVCISCAMKAAKLGFAFEVLLKSQTDHQTGDTPALLSPVICGRRASAPWASISLRTWGTVPSFHFPFIFGESFCIWSVILN